MNKDIKELLNYQYVPFEAKENLKEIIKKEDSALFAMIDAYNYGYIQGKRAERAKKKLSPNGINMSKIKNCEVRKYKYDLNSDETQLDIIRLSIKIQDAIKEVIGKENCKLTNEHAHMIAVIALKLNSSKEKN